MTAFMDTLTFFLTAVGIVLALGAFYTALDLWEEHDERKARKRRLRYEAEAWRQIMSQTEGDTKAYAAANVLHCTYLSRGKIK